MRKSLILCFVLFLAWQSVQGQRRSSQTNTPSTALKEERQSSTGRRSTTISAPTSSTSRTRTKEIKEPKMSYWAIGVSSSTNSNPLAGITIKNTFGNNPLKLSFISLDFINVNEYRQFKSPFAYNGQGYIEGKINYLYELRPSYGKEFALLQAADDTSPSLKGFIAAGPSLGLQTPYYVQIARNLGGRSTLVSIPYSDIFKNLYPNPAIVGTGGWFEGIADLEMVPGAHAKGGIILDYRNFKGNYFGIEFGASFDYFTQPVVQLFNVEGRNFYSGAYICIYFGKSHR